jgi:hypothetical protein
LLDTTATWRLRFGWLRLNRNPKAVGSQPLDPGIQ